MTRRPVLILTFIGGGGGKRADVLSAGCWGAESIKSLQRWSA